MGFCVNRVSWRIQGAGWMPPGCVLQSSPSLRLFWPFKTRLASALWGCWDIHSRFGVTGMLFFGSQPQQASMSWLSTGPGVLRPWAVSSLERLRNFVGGRLEASRRDYKRQATFLPCHFLPTSALMLPLFCSFDLNTTVCRPR